MFPSTGDQFIDKEKAKREARKHAENGLAENNEYV